MLCSSSYSWSNDNSKYYDPSNLVIIRLDIHRRFHRMFGNNTVPFDFYRFCVSEFPSTLYSQELLRSNPDLSRFITPTLFDI